MNHLYNISVFLSIASFSAVCTITASWFPGTPINLLIAGVLITVVSVLFLEGNKEVAALVIVAFLLGCAIAQFSWLNLFLRWNSSFFFYTVSGLLIVSTIVFFLWQELKRAD